MSDNGTSNVLPFPLSRTRRTGGREQDLLLQGVPPEHAAWVSALEAAVAVYALAEEGGQEAEARAAWGCVCVAYERAWKLGTWDEMLVPKPFSAVAVRYGSPFRVPRDADEEAFRLQLEADLNRLETWAEAFPG